MNAGKQPQLNTIDPSFGAQGKTTLNDLVDDAYIDAGGGEPRRALAALNNGNLLVAGGVYGTAPSIFDYIVCGLDRDGRVTEDFARGAGFIQGNVAISTGLFASQALPLDDGTFLLLLRGQALGAWHVAKFHESGELITWFGDAGYLELDSKLASDEPKTREGFLIRAPGGGFFFIGDTQPENIPEAARVTPDEAPSAVALRSIAMKFLSDSQLDTRFAGKGYVLFDAGIGTGRSTEAFVHSDGRLLISTASTLGSGCVICLLPDGERDSTFGDDGAVTIPWDSPISGYRTEIEIVAQAGDGRIWVLGRATGGDGFLMRLNGNGSFDTSFNEGKIVVVRSVAFKQPLLLHPLHDGVLVVGEKGYGATFNKGVTVVCYDASGQLDDSFGDGGYVSIDLSREGFNFSLPGLLLQDHRLVLLISNGAYVSAEKATLEAFLLAS